MSHFSTNSVLALAAALALGAAACAAQPTPPPVAAAPPSQAFTQAAGGVTAPQGDPGDGVQFVDQERTEPKVHNDPPTMSLNPSATQHPKQ